MTPDTRKADLFRELGYAGDTAPYEHALARANLSRPDKPRIHLSKRAQVERILAASFRRICARGDCTAAAQRSPDGRTPVPAAAQDFCDICAGSSNKAAVARMVAASRSAGWSKLCIVGGSSATREELESIVAGRLDLRLVEGAGVRRTLRDAQADILWADLVVIWGGTELDHKVSNLYKSAKVLTLHRRGIAHLADEVSRCAAGGNTQT